MNTLKNDLIILISGSSGIGKTTIAKQLLKILPDSFIIEEWDLIREALRTNNSNIIKTLSDTFRGQIEDLDNQLEDIFHCIILNRSTSDLTVDEILEQSKIFLYPLMSICKRIQKKKLCAIIEGVNLPIKLLLTSKETKEFFEISENIVFVNLYATNYAIYREHLNYRAKQRNVESIDDEHFENIINYNLYNSELSLETSKFVNYLKSKIINVDVTSSQFATAEDIAHYIFKFVCNRT